MSNRVYTGRSKELIDSLNTDIEGAGTIKIIVSIIMESGVKLIEESLKSAVHRGAKIQILLGTYLGITEPAALYRLRSLLHGKGEIKIFKGENSFHPKGYFIEGDKGRHVYVGSSNISQMGLIRGLDVTDIIIYFGLMPALNTLMKLILYIVNCMIDIDKTSYMKSDKIFTRRLIAL